jgi:hypothetical protein
MCRFGKRYKEKGMEGGPTRIVEKTHPSKQTTTKAITMDASQLLSDELNPLNRT